MIREYIYTYIAFKFIFFKIYTVQIHVYPDAVETVGRNIFRQRIPTLYGI
jgi:hypothetical protein